MKMNLSERDTCEDLLLLLVEPNAGLRLKIRDSTKRTGLRLLEAEDGRAALNLARRTSKPSLAIIELSLPDMNGFHLAKVLYNRYSLPIIMTIATAEPNLAAMMLDQCAEDVMQKPYDTRELMARLLRLLPRTCLQVSVDDK